jgi:hypothetical protein
MNIAMRVYTALCRLFSQYKIIKCTSFENCEHETMTSECRKLHASHKHAYSSNEKGTRLHSILFKRHEGRIIFAFSLLSLRSNLGSSPGHARSGRRRYWESERVIIIVMGYTYIIQYEMHFMIRDCSSIGLYWSTRIFFMKIKLCA